MYRSPFGEEQRSQAANKRKHQKDISNKHASFEPPEKCHHFDDDDFEEPPQSKRRSLNVEK